MPELPEVETIVRGLARALPGRRIRSVEVSRPNVVAGSVPGFVRRLNGATITRVSRRAKFIVIDLEAGPVWVTHLRMSGRYRIVGRGATPPVYTRATFTLDDDRQLLYVDARTLGLLELLAPRAWRSRAAALGPEPLDPSFTPAVLLDRLRASGQPIKTFLLDQTRIAGLGNIYAAEALWRARISPRRRARNVGPVRAARLHRAIVDVLAEAVNGSGTSLGGTVLNFADAEGDRGAFYDWLTVYDREGEPCRRCGAPIHRIVQAQRSTYYCTRCQR